MDFYSANNDSKQEYLYVLLKYRWLMKQDNPEPVLKAKLEEEILKTANDKIDQLLETKKMIAEVVANGFAKSALKKIESFRELYQTTIKEAQNATPFTIEQWERNSRSLEKKATNILKINAALRNIGYCSIDEAEIGEISDSLEYIRAQREALKGKSETLSELIKEMDKTAEVIDSKILNLGKKLSGTDRMQVNKITDALKENPAVNKQMDALSNKYSEDPDKGKQELGKNMKKMASIGQKIVQLLEDIKSIFMNVWRKGNNFLFFKQKYMTEVGNSHQKKDKLDETDPQESDHLASGRILNQ